MGRIAVVVVVLLVVATAGLYAIGAGVPGDRWEEGTPVADPLSPENVAARDQAVADAATELAVPRPKQILFGDLHVHTTFSPDAFAMALPMTGGDGARPISHACDFARYCANLDFWSVNDHAVGITPWKWEQTVAAIRQCDAVSRSSNDPDVTPFLGWEWTQMGTTPDNHYGHKNGVMRRLDEVPDRPVTNTTTETITQPPASHLTSSSRGKQNPDT